MVLGNNGSRSGIDIVDGILGSFYGSPMLRSSHYWPRPCTASTSGYPNFQPRHAANLVSMSFPCAWITLRISVWGCPGPQWEEVCSV